MIGLRIKQYRERLGLTQEELGVKAGISGSPRQRIYQIESGHRDPSPEVLRRVCEAMGTTPGELTGTIPHRLKEILDRGSQPFLQSENEFYYVAGVFVAALISIFNDKNKLKTEYFIPQNIARGQHLKDRIRRELFMYPTSSSLMVESETRNKLIAAFWGWETKVDGLEKFNQLNLMEDFMLGYFQTSTYPVI